MALSIHVYSLCSRSGKQQSSNPASPPPSHAFPCISHSLHLTLPCFSSSSDCVFFPGSARLFIVKKCWAPASVPINQANQESFFPFAPFRFRIQYCAPFFLKVRREVKAAAAVLLTVPLFSEKQMWYWGCPTEFHLLVFFACLQDYYTM